MNLLAFDTSTERASIAVSNATTVFSEEILGVRSHAEQILVIIDKLMRQVQLEWRQLDGIVFGQGPGSFTGLRVACSVAKGLAFAHDLPVYPVGSLAAIAHKAESLSSSMKADLSAKNILTYLVMIDARMQQVYWSYAKSAPQVDTVQDIVIPGVEPIGLIGCGWQLYRDQLSPSIQARIQTVHEIYPDAIAMIQMVKQGIVTAVSAQAASPLYIRDQVTHQ